MGGWTEFYRDDFTSTLLRYMQNFLASFLYQIQGYILEI